MKRGWRYLKNDKTVVFVHEKRGGRAILLYDLTLPPCRAEVI